MATTPAPAAPQPINHFGRITGVFFSPKETLADVARRPSWLLPIILLAVLGLAATYFFTQRVGWESFAMKQMSQDRSFEQLPEDQKQERLRLALPWFAGIGYFFGIAGNLLFALIMTLVLWGAFNLLAGAGLNFKTSFGIASHSLLPGVVSTLLFFPVLFLKDPSEFDLFDSENPLPSNLGAFLAGDTPKWLMKLAGSVDLFIIWIIILLALGFSAANPKKISLGKALGIIGGIYALLTLIQVGFAAFS